MEASILTSTKKVLGLADDDTSFDEDIIMHINSVFFTLRQLGIGSDLGFTIGDETAVWSDFLADDSPQQSPVKTYVWLKVRMLFDPPVTSYTIEATERQIAQLEWRLNVDRESTEWVDPDPPLPPDEDEVIVI